MSGSIVMVEPLAVIVIELGVIVMTLSPHGERDLVRRLDVDGVAGVDAVRAGDAEGALDGLGLVGVVLVGDALDDHRQVAVDLDELITRDVQRCRCGEWSSCGRV